MHSQVGARASRRLAAAVGLILLPALVLGYFGIRALAEKEAGLRTTYTATTALVRDRLAGEFTQLESALAADVDRIARTDESLTRLRAALGSIGTSRPWLAAPFVLRADGGLITANLTARGSAPRTPAIDPVVALPRLAAAIRDAETAEFAENDPARALQKYRQALGVASSDAARGLVLMRVGRTLFKLRRFDEGIAAPANVVVKYGAFNFIRGVTPQGKIYTIARNRYPGGSELAGSCFAPNDDTFFVNIQAAGLTLAITGPWRERKA